MSASQRWKDEHMKFLFFLTWLCYSFAANATWCTSTQLVFNKENVKADNPEQPFRIGTLDEKGYTLAVIKGSDKTTYKYLRNIFIDKIEFREFRYTNFIFQLAIPDKDGRMTYREVFVDAKGIERGFAGVCS